MGLLKRAWLQIGIMTLVVCILMSGMVVHGEDNVYYTDISFADGGTVDGWVNESNYIRSRGSISEGPGSGYTGSNFLYFTDSGNDREISGAKAYKNYKLEGVLKSICEKGYLAVKVECAYRGWGDDGDNCSIFIESLDYYGNILLAQTKTAYCQGDNYWSYHNWGTQVNIHKDAEYIRVRVQATRTDGDDLDVYLDDFKLVFFDTHAPSISRITVTGAADRDGKPVQAVGDSMWLNNTDTIKGKMAFNEYVSVPIRTNNIRTNMVDIHNNNNSLYGGLGYDGMPAAGGYSTDFLTEHDFKISLNGADYTTSTDGKIEIEYLNNSPFGLQVKDYAGRGSENDGTRHYLNNSGVTMKLDSVAPEILTPLNAFSTYDKDRGAVDIIIGEKDNGKAQSPLSVNCYWEYKDAGGLTIKTPAASVLAGNGSIGEYTHTYKATIEYPTLSADIKYQDLVLHAAVSDAARNKAVSLTPELGTGDYTKYVIKGTDDSAPEVIWSKTRNFSKEALPYSADSEKKYIFHEECDPYTEVSVSGSSEDTSYAKGRHVYFSISEPESGIKEVSYLWAKDIYTEAFAGKPITAANGIYMVEGANRDNLSVGTYYLNIIAKNITGTYKIYSKAFKFDNQVPVDNSENGIFVLNKGSIQIKAMDETLGDVFLYAFAEYDIASGTYSSIPAPNISNGIAAQGDWKLAAFGTAEGSAKTGTIVIPEDKTGITGRYKLITRIYDKFYHYTLNELELIYDRTPPALEVINEDNATTWLKNHNVILRISDNRPMDTLDITEISWVKDKNDTGTAAVYTVDGQQVTAADSTGTLNGSYLLKVRAKDALGNEMISYASGDNGEITFNFDNSSPDVKLMRDTENPVRTVSFLYSDLIDPQPINDISSVKAFKYGISNSPVAAPNSWHDIDVTASSGSVTHPEAFTTGEVKYLHFSLADVLGNLADIATIGPFIIDRTAPSGGISFEEGYINKENVFLKLEVDELKSLDEGACKIAVSSDRSKLESPEISDVKNTIWENRTFENGIYNKSFSIIDTSDGVKSVYARFMDAAGNVSEIYEASVILDKTPPAGSIAYDKTVPTRDNVTASLTITDDSPVTVLNNNNSGTYVFNKNGEFEFVLADAAGNKAHIMAAVSNIDRDPPKATITYSQPRDIWTRDSVSATLQLADENGYNVLSAGGDSHTFNENGEFLFEYVDGLGNSGSMKAEVKNIDKEAPTGQIITAFSDTAPVTVYLAVYEPVRVTNNGGSFRYIFEDNGEFTFEFEDKAGNTGQATAAVDTITSENKYVDVAYNDSGLLTNSTVEVEFTTFSGISCITSPTVTEDVYGSYSYSFTENGDKPVHIKVFMEAGEESRTVVGSVYNIDTVPPEAEVYISCEQPTNQNVTATLLTRDDKGKTINILNNSGNSTYIFTENGTFTFEFADEAGNTGYKEITVGNIDKTVPEGKVRYPENASGGESKLAELYFEGGAEAVTILNNNGFNRFEFVENGEFTFRYADEAGNTGETTAKVTSFSDGSMTGNVEYYIGALKVEDPEPTNESIVAKLVLSSEGGPYRIVNNGGEASYTFEHNGEFTFVFEDIASGRRGFAAAKVDCIDKEAPELQILADTLNATNKDVIVTVSYSDINGIKELRHNLEAGNLISEPGKLTYTCKENKTIQVTAVDNIGNEVTKELIVDYIDRMPPTGAIVYAPDSLTNQNVKAVLVLDEQGVVTNNNNRAEYIFTRNGEFTFEFQDNAGNKASKTASVNWIDKVPPIVELEYSSKAMTNQPVEVTVKANKPVTVQNNGGETKRIFYGNGEYSFRVMDAAGNLVVVKAEVGNIDTEAPKITLKGAAFVSMLQDEAYTEQGFIAVDNVDGEVTGRVVLEGNVNTRVPGIYILKYKASDAVGNYSEESRTVKVISKNEFVFSINGIVTDAAQLIMNDSKINIKGMGNEGSYIIKWTKGTKTQAFFKGQGNIALPDAVIELENNSWYTFFMQDRERKTKCIQIYINE